jgi:hypothetical protein
MPAQQRAFCFVRGHVASAAAFSLLAKSGSLSKSYAKDVLSLLPAV